MMKSFGWILAALMINFKNVTSNCLTTRLSSVVTAKTQFSTPLDEVNFNVSYITQPNKAFCATVDKKFTIQFDFSKIKTITKLDIRGFELNGKMLMLHGFTLHFSIDKKFWFDYYGDSDRLKIFDVAWLFISSKSKVLEHVLPKPAVGRFMQLRPVLNNNLDSMSICVNIALYGCNQVLPPTVESRKEVKVYLNSQIDVNCQSEGTMNYTLSFGRQKQTALKTSLYQELSINEVIFVQFEDLKDYSCITTDNLLLCKKTLICSAQHLFPPYQNAVSETTLIIQTVLPDQLESFVVSRKTISSVFLNWTLPFLGDIPRKYLRLELICSTLNYSVVMPSKIRTFELNPLTAYKSCRCSLELQLKSNMSVDLKQKPVILEFTSLSERPDILPKINVTRQGSRKLKLSIEAKFENPKFGKLIGCYVHATQLRGRQFQGTPQSQNWTFPASDFDEIQLKDLIPWTHYNISVAVFNDDFLVSNTSYLEIRTLESRPSGAPIIEVTSKTATTITCSVISDKQFPDNGVITGYEFEYNPGNISQLINIDKYLGEHQFFHMQNLKPFTLYQIRSRSKNSAGYGPYSDFVSAVTEEHTPNQPTDIDIVKKHNSKNLFLTWKPPSTPNGNITKYEIQITLRNRTVLTAFTSSSTDFDTNIPLGSVLAIAIRAYTSKGNGEFSLVVQVYQIQSETANSDYGQNSRMLIITFCIILLLLVALGICGFVYYKRCHSQPQQNSPKQSLLLTYVPSTPNENEVLLFQENSRLPRESLADPVKSHEPVPVESFAQYINRIEQHDYELLACEFKNEAMSGKCYPWEVADRPENRPKNRYGDIAAYDHSRVILKFDCKRKQSDYINASYVQGCNCKSVYKYISSQGPIENGVNDFWHMIFQENIKIIVMLTNLIENEKNKCYQYWPDEGSIKYGSVTVTLVKIDKTADYVIRLFHIQKVGCEIEEIRLVRQFHFVSWPDHGVPDYPTALLSLRRRVRHYYSDDSPMLVHCSAGVGRSGCFILIDNMLDRIDHERTVDIFNYLQHLRSRRINMVQTLEQYIFAHEAILEYIMFGNTEITLDDLDKKTRELMKGTGMADEFSVLCQSTQSDMQGSTLYKVLLREGKYIDASFVDGYKQRNSFILTLAPKEDCVNEFWKMVLEQQCHTIVMLSKSQEGIQDYYRYWPDVDGECSYHDLNVFLSSEIANGNIITRKIKVTTSKHRCEVNHFQYVDWPNGDVPHRRSYPNICTLMQSVEKSQQQLGNGPIIVHAGNDYGRSGTFVAIYNSTERLKVEQLVDVLQCVRTIRISQPLAVDNVSQYQFVYQLLRIYLEGFENYWNYKDYKVCKSPKNSISAC